MDRCYWTTHKGKRYRIPGCWPAVIHGDDWCTCYDTGKNKRKISYVKKLKLTIKKLKKELQKCKQR